MVTWLQPWRAPGLGLGAALLLLGSAWPVWAQSGNLSDVTGAIVTTGDIAGGSFQPGGRGGAAPVSRLYANPNAQGAVNTALANATPQLQEILGVTATDIAGPSADQTQTLINTLSNTAKGVSVSQAEQLVAALVQIWQSQSVSPTQLLNAVTAFNDIVNTADNDYILNPPTSLQQIRAVLNPLVLAALGETS
ncbi:MAG: hypothetical protein MJA27_28100 [Pseudanabaenales cyanobacterium]|nr:hypothetical protein [Pseudanabaenales cyanobacterium]